MKEYKHFFIEKFESVINHMLGIGLIYFIGTAAIDIVLIEHITESNNDIEQLIIKQNHKIDSLITIINTDK